MQVSTDWLPTETERQNSFNIYKGGEQMSDKEKEVAKEVMSNLNAVPTDGKDFVRGYLQGRLDGIKADESKGKEDA